MVFTKAHSKRGDHSTSFMLFEILDVLVTWFQNSYILHAIPACSNFRHKSWWRLKAYEIHIHIQYSYYETTTLQTILCSSLCCWMFVMLSPFRKKITVVEDFQDLVRIPLYQIELSLGGYSNILKGTCQKLLSGFFPLRGYPPSPTPP